MIQHSKLDRYISLSRKKKEKMGKIEEMHLESTMESGILYN
jgi:hypothetical protein